MRFLVSWCWQMFSRSTGGLTRGHPPPPYRFPSAEKEKEVMQVEHSALRHFRHPTRMADKGTRKKHTDGGIYRGHFCRTGSFFQCNDVLESWEQVCLRMEMRCDFTITIRVLVKYFGGGGRCGYVALLVYPGEGETWPTQESLSIMARGNVVILARNVAKTLFIS